MQSLSLLRRVVGAGNVVRPTPFSPSLASSSSASQRLRRSALPPTVPYVPADDDGGEDGDNEQAAVAAEDAVRSGWDPDGLFAGASGNSSGGGDLFARQQARRAAEQRARLEREQLARPAPAAVVTTTFDEPPVPVPDDWNMISSSSNSNNRDGPLVADLSPAQRQELSAAVADVFPTLDLGHPGLRVLHLRPTVLAIDGFASSADCEAWMREAEASGRLAVSRVGAGHAGGGGGATGGSSASPPPGTSVSYDAAQRTSTNLLIDPATRRVAPVLALLSDAFQERALELLDACRPPAAAAAADDEDADNNKTSTQSRPGSAWGQPGRMPLPRQYTFEAPQVTRYLPPEASEGRSKGQLFGEHEDAFPRVVARANGFQRHATLLLYLNGRATEEGGLTCFPHMSLGASTATTTLAVTPEAGRLLVFFPSSDDGTPDARTLHAATEVCSGGPKWVMQQWVARGYASPSALRQMQQQGEGAAAAPAAAAAAAGAQQPLTRKERRERAKQDAAAAKKQAGPRRKKA